jgi:hypothetical protein
MSSFIEKIAAGAAVVESVVVPQKFHKSVQYLAIDRGRPACQ